MNFQGSPIEEQAIIKAYNEGRGSLSYVMKHIPFVLVEDKNRVQNIIFGENH